MRQQIPHFRQTRLALLLVTALLFSLSPIAAAQEEAALSFTITPGAIQTGRTRDVVIKSAQGADLTGFELLNPPAETNVSFEDVGGITARLTDNNRSIVVRIKVDQDADPQLLPLVLVHTQNGQETARYTVSLQITEFKPRPMSKQAVPPGLEDGQAVDAHVQPMSYKATRDVFGRQVAKAYYAVTVGLGNNTGFDLQITKLGFVTSIAIDMPDVNPETGRPVYKNDQPQMHKEFLEISAIDRTLVRGSIEKEQSFGRRALAMNLISGVGMFTGGFLPFFHALGPRANFSSFNSLLNGQLKEGFGLAVPDLTIRQLNRLENNLVMHEDFILPNNAERNTVIFIPRRALALSQAENDKPIDDLIEVRRRLGRLVIVGRPVERYANREIVVRSGAGATEASGNGTTERVAPAGSGNASGTLAVPATTPTPTITNITPNTGLNFENKVVTITGSNFVAGTQVSFGGAPALTVTLQSPGTLLVTVPNHAPGAVDVLVTNPNGQPAASPTKYTYFTELHVGGSDRPTGAAAGGDTLKIFGRGFLPNAKVLFDGTEVPAADVHVAADGESITVKTPAHAAGNAHVTVVNPAPYPSQQAQELTGGFTYNP